MNDVIGTAAANILIKPAVPSEWPGCSEPGQEWYKGSKGRVTILVGDHTVTLSKRMLEHLLERLNG